jgi:hypothetical protein
VANGLERSIIDLDYRSDLRFWVVLWRHLSNPSPALKRALKAYRELDLSRVSRPSTPRRQVKQAVRLSAAQVTRLVERYQSGATVYELAAEFGVHRETSLCV